MDQNNTKQPQSPLMVIGRDGGNKYLFDFDNRYLALAHPALLECLHEGEKASSQQEDDYYRRKCRYLASHGIGQPKKYEQVPLNAAMVDYQLADLRQIVFEVTDSCNLKCRYCAYGELYSDYDERRNSKMSLADMSGIIDFLIGKWSGEKSLSRKKPMYISFYGGEPLLNMEFVTEAVEYFNGLDLDSRQFMFSMTTNAMLLDRHMDFLARNNFHLLISLDGDRDNNGYRERLDGSSSFDSVVANIDRLLNAYPDYFRKSVNFSAVLHSKNSVLEINEFLRRRYGKRALISEVDGSGIRPEKRAKFNKMYRNMGESLRQIENYEEYEKEMLNSPDVNVAMFLQTYLPFYYKSYNDLLGSGKSSPEAVTGYIPTGTCIPFSKKMFITVNGKILACERIGQQFALGTAGAQGAELDSESIAGYYNDLYAKVKKQCATCLRKQACIQCLFNLDGIDSRETVACKGYFNDQRMRGYADSMIGYLEKNPAEYHRIMTEVILS